MGPKGMAAGSFVGSILGTFAGCATIGLLTLTGTTMEETRYWQYKWKSERINVYREAVTEGIADTELGSRDKYQKHHDEKLGKKVLDLNMIPDESQVSKEKVEEIKPKIEEVKKSEEKNIEIQKK